MKQPAWLNYLSPLDALLIGLPLTVIAQANHWTTAAFLCSCLAIVPLAGLMGKATEILAGRVGEGLGGLLNATFGNACELIIAFAALRAGMHDIVKASLTGSIIGNILLVLGASMLAGGMKYTTQKFNRTAATTTATLLALAAISLTVPAIFHTQAQVKTNEDELALGIAIILFITYICSLIFTLKTHKHHYSGAPEDLDEAAASDALGAQQVVASLPSVASAPDGLTEAVLLAPAIATLVQETNASAAPSLDGGSDGALGTNSHHNYAFAVAPETEQAEGSEHCVGEWSTRTCLIVLGLATVMVAWLSEVLVHTVEVAAATMHMNRIFIGLILIAIIGNAAEHSTAILMARKNKMDLAMGIALGSGAQIALFVAPLLVFASYFYGPAPMDLNFTLFEVMAVVVSVLVLTFVATDGETNWLEGVQLLAVYSILGIAFYFAA